MYSTLMFGPWKLRLVDLKSAPLKENYQSKFIRICLKENSNREKKD
jgi:hypothetical protein